MKRLYKGLITTGLCGGLLLLSVYPPRCREYHEGDLAGGRFKLTNESMNGKNYGRLDLISEDEKMKVIFETEGDPLYSDGKFSVVSWKKYSGDRWSTFSPVTECPLGVPEYISSVFEKDEGRRGILRSYPFDYASVLEHVSSCSGKSPCRGVARDKKEKIARREPPIAVGRKVGGKSLLDD